MQDVCVHIVLVDVCGYSVIVFLDCEHVEYYIGLVSSLWTKKSECIMQITFYVFVEGLNLQCKYKTFVFDFLNCGFV